MSTTVLELTNHYTCSWFDLKQSFDIINNDSVLGLSSNFMECLGPPFINVTVLQGGPSIKTKIFIYIKLRRNSYVIRFINVYMKKMFY